MPVNKSDIKIGNTELDGFTKILKSVFTIMQTCNC